MKRLYFDDEHGCSEAYPQLIILLEVLLSVAGATLSIAVIGISAQNPSTLFRPLDKLNIRSCTLDQAWIVKWMSGHVLVSHDFVYMVIICIKLGRIH